MHWIGMLVNAEADKIGTGRHLSLPALAEQSETGQPCIIMVWLVCQCPPPLHV